MARCFAPRLFKEKHSTLATFYTTSNINCLMLRKVARALKTRAKIAIWAGILKIV
jgi:hypothetical protein